MKNKLISINIILIFIFTSLISAEAIAAAPRIDLDEYQIEATDVNNVYVTGTVTIGAGQIIGLYNSSETIIYNFAQVNNSGDEESFKIQIPTRYLNEGENTFKVKSLPLKGVVNSSNPKTVTVKVKGTKKDQIITASDISLKVGESKNINAKVSSGLSLTYKSESPSIATVDVKGKVIGRKAGTTKITITQSGNSTYKPVNKTISVKVIGETKKYTVTYNSNGGKGKMSSKTVKEGSTITIAKNKFTKPGYVFKGWAISKNGKVKYPEGKSIKITSNINLYAVWEKEVISNKKTITNLAFKYAYPLGTSSKKSSYKRGGKPTAEYKKALNKVYKGQHFWSNASRKGASCDVFVGTVIRSTGYDTNFPAGLGKQIPYMNSHKNKWTKVKWDGKKSSLKSGDILYSKHNKTSKYNNGHIYIYVVKNGKGYIANASAKTYYGKIINYSDRRKLKKVRYVWVFRAKNAKIR